MSVMAAGIVSTGFNARTFARTAPPASDGTHEPEILALSPGIYLKFGGDLSDSSGSGRDGTLVGSGGGYVSALAANVGTGNTAFDTQGTAAVSVANAAADTTRTNPTGSGWATLAQADRAATALSHLDGYRFIGAVEISIWFNPQTLPGAGDRAVIVSKSHTVGITTSAAFAESHPISATAGQTVPGGSFEAYFDANGAVHVEVRSFRGRLCRIRTPDGAVSTGNAYHLSVTMDYSGVTARLNGAQFENGIPNNLHVFGLSANIRGVILNNSYNWMLGKAAWGGQADVILDEFAVFYPTYGSELSTANHNTLAQQGSTPAALGHYIWDRLTVNVSSYATIQAAVNDVNTSGGGTVQLNSTTYNQNVQIPSNVRIKGNGSGLSIINGQITTANPSETDLGAGSGDLAVGDQTITVSNSAAAEHIVVVRANAGATTADPAPEDNRFDRRWNPVGDSRNPFNADAEPFIIESRNGSSITVQGLGQTFAIAASNRDGIFVFTPSSWIALENLRVVAPDGTNRAVQITRTRNFRIAGCFIESDLSSCVRADEHSINGSIINCTMQTRAELADPVTGGTTPLQCARGTKDIVFSNLIIGQMRRTIFDWEGHYQWGPILRAEAHAIEDRSTYYGATNRYGAHETNADCLFWACDTAAGGINPQGWKQDVRWFKGGTDSGITNPGRGNITWDAGAADAWIREFWGFDSVTEWFNGLSNVWVKRCRFENIETNDTTPGNAHTGVQNGTGADVNTYSNVDSPSGSWTAS